MYFFKKSLSPSVVYSKCGHEYEKIFKEDESIDILEITNIQEYQKIYSHVWRKHKLRN